MTARTIEEVRGEIRLTNDRLGELRDELKQAIADAAPHKVGDVVEFLRDSYQHESEQWEPGIVRSVAHQSYGTAGEFRYRISPKTKAGAWSKRDRTVWEEDVRAVTP